MLCGMDRDITTIAETQHGVFTADQAKAQGYTREAIRHQARATHWDPLGDLVFRMAGSPRTWEQRLMAVVLASGPLAAASHRSAAALLGVPGFDRRGTPEVTTPRRHRYRTDDGIVHRWRPFPDHHLTVTDGIPTTRVARTLVDLAGVVHPGRLARAVDNCLASEMVGMESLRATFLELAGRGRKGIAAMRAVLGDREGDYVAPASELEALFLELIVAAGLPEPVRQFNAGDANDWIGRIDFAYPSVGVLIELDGRRHHSALLDRQADERRDARLRAAGWRHVVRLSWSDVVHRPAEVLALLANLLAGGAVA